MLAYVRWLAVLVVLMVVTACRPARPTPPVADQEAEQSVVEVKPLVFMAGYKPQANLPFVGVYVAQERGFFTEEGLEVTIRHSSGRGEHIQLLMAGEVHITTQDAAVLLKRRAEPGLPLVSLALIGQRGQQAFVALKESGLKTPKDWEGRLVGYKGTPPPDLYAILDAVGADVNKVQLVNVGFDPRVLVEGKVDVYPVFKSNEPYLLNKWGYELVMWDAADYGIPTLGLAYVSTPEVIEQDPERIARFIRAALRGITYAVQSPEEAVDIVLKYAGPETDREHMRYMLETEWKDAQSEITRRYGLGWQTWEQWQALHDMLLKYQALSRPVDVQEVFTTQFLPGQ